MVYPKAYNIIIDSRQFAKFIKIECAYLITHISQSIKVDGRAGYSAIQDSFVIHFAELIPSSNINYHTKIWYHG